MFSKFLEFGGLFERKLFEHHWSRGSVRQPVVVEKICILPIGSGLWLPVKVWTSSINKTARDLQASQAMSKLLEAQLKSQLDVLNKRIRDVGFHVPTALVSSDQKGLYRMVKFDGAITVEYSEESFRLETGVKKPEVRKEVYRPTIKLSRPRQNNGGNNGKNNGGN